MIKKSDKEPLAAAFDGHERKLSEVNVEALSDLGYDFVPMSFEVAGGCTPTAELTIFYPRKLSFSICPMLKLLPNVGKTSQ